MINCRPDGANTNDVDYCSGFTRLRLVTPLPMPWPLLTELSPNINDINEKFMVITCEKNKS